MKKSGLSCLTGKPHWGEISFLVENELQVGFLPFRAADKNGGSDCNLFAAKTTARMRGSFTNIEI
jgi:hypothetical protein